MSETGTARSAIGAYLGALRDTLRRGNATEPSYYPHLQAFLEALAPGITATTNPKRIECGAPDFAISRSTTHGPVTSGYIEAKEPGVSLDSIEKTDQLQRYLTLPNLLLTDFLTFRWYVDGELRQEVRLGRLDSGGRLRPASVAERAQAVELLRAFLAHAPEQVNDARQLAERLARLTHLIRGVIVQALERDEASAMLRDLRQAFEQTLVPDQTAAEFADMFAQTLAYGLFAARCNHTESARFRRLGAAAEIPKTNPFLRRLFDTITGTDLDDEPYAGFVDDLAQLLADTDMDAVLADFGRRSGREDPVIHFYETFLAAYDAKLRKVRGVYYTPEPVVSYIVRSVDHLLKTQFGCPAGLADTARTADGQPRVLVLDPACGTGTFLYAVVDHIRKEFRRQGNAGMWSGFVREHLLPRLFGFELLMGAYAVAHFKLGMQLAAQDLPSDHRDTWAYDFAGNDRLGVYLTNTLEEAVRRSDMLLARFISDEANAAVSVKRDLPIMVVLGNPPYSSSVTESEWIMSCLKKYRKGVEETRLHINREEWKFLCFAQSRIENTGAGIVGFVINNTFLDATSLRGMRASLLESFDEIFILNLHGSTRGQSAKFAGAIDQNVFHIEQGVTIALCVRRGPSSSPGKVFHASLTGTQMHKYTQLSEHDVSTIQCEELRPRAPGYLFVPQQDNLEEEYRGWPSIRSIFSHTSSGVQTKRDKLTIQFSADDVIPTVQRFTELDPDAAREEFSLKSDGRDWTVERAQSDIQEAGITPDRVRALLYRPFDVRFTFYTGKSRGFHGYPRRAIMQHMLSGRNIGLIAMRQAVAPTYSHFLVTRHINCHGTLYLGNRGQDYLFPLYLRSDSDVSNSG